MNQQELNTIKEGTILYTSWGYDQTQNDFCIVKKVGKTLLCRMVKKRITGTENNFMCGLAEATTEEIGEEFRLRISKSKKQSDYFWLAGSYPYCYDRDGKRLGSFWIWNGKPKHESWYA